jgi:hypothetical protein
VYIFVGLYIKVMSDWVATIYALYTVLYFFITIYIPDCGLSTHTYWEVLQEGVENQTQLLKSVYLGRVAGMLKGNPLSPWQIGSPQG